MKPMCDLKRKKQELDEEVQRISKELKQLRRQQAGNGKVKRISEAQRSAARAVMVMREGEPTAAMTFLRMQCKGVDAYDTKWVDEESALRAWWVSAGEDTKNMYSTIGETNKKLHGAIKRAQIFIVDEDLEKWVAFQNVTKGINPVPAMTLQEAKLARHRAGMDVPPKHQSARKWLQRWRRRMGLRLRRFPAIEPMDKKEMHDKARAQTDAQKNIRPVSFCIPGRSSAQKRSAVFRTLF